MHGIESQIDFLFWFLIILFAVVGAFWRWWDGRGYGPNWLRLTVCGFLAVVILSPLYWPFIVLLTGAWIAIWVFRQKHRGSLKDMMLRWTLPFVGFGIALALLGKTAAAFLMSLAGLCIAGLVVIGATVRMPWLPKLKGIDSTAVTEFLVGGIAFGALTLSMMIR